MGDVLGLALPFFGLIALGYVAAKVNPLPRAGLAWMNVFIIYVSLPALFFNLLSRTPVEQLASGGFIFATTFGTYLVFLLCFALGLLATGEVPRAAMQGLAGAYGNIGYMGPGLAIAAFGEAAVVPVALVFCFDNTLHFAMAPFLMAVGGEGEPRPPLRLAASVVWKIVSHPFILATIVGVAAAAIGFRPPEPVDRLLNYLAGAAAPCALFVMGVTVALAPRLSLPPALVWLTLVKLAVHPVLVWLLLGWVGAFEPLWVYSAVLLAALPTAANVFVIAQQYDVWVDEASSMVVVTTIASVATVTGLLYLMTTGSLPVDPFP